jgi:NAD(P)-dependent dehydrogenase (short-subunit alcohol dehydrogenase family)
MTAAVIVTGATRGVGRAVAAALAAEGCPLVVTGRDRARLDDLVEELRGSGAEVDAVAGDVSDEEVVAATVQRGLQRFGAISGLVNNAGIVADRTTLKMTVDEFDRVLAVNLRGAWLCGRAVAAAARDTGTGCSIVNIVSEVAFYGAVGQSNYMASKAGLVALTVAWAQELARYGIRANGVSPAALTQMSEVVLQHATAAAERAGRPAPEAADLGIGTPDEVAPLVTYLLGEQSREVTGQVFSFNGRNLGVWSFPRIAAQASAAGWTVADIAAAVDSVRLELQVTNPPEWMNLPAGPVRPGLENPTQ